MTVYVTGDQHERCPDCMGLMLDRPLRTLERLVHSSSCPTASLSPQHQHHQATGAKAPAPVQESRMASNVLLDIARARAGRGATEADVQRELAKLTAEADRGRQTEASSRESEIQALYARNPALAMAAGLVHYDVSKPIHRGNVLSYGEMVPVVSPRPGPGSKG